MYVVVAAALVPAGVTVFVQRNSPAHAGVAVKSVAPGVNWQWQLSGTVDTTILDSYSGPKLMDIDAEDATTAVVSQLKAKGIYTVGYLETGSWENYRLDASDFPTKALGNVMPGYPNERFLDIRAGQPYSAEVLAVIEARIASAASKGFQGIEPDLDDTGANVTGCVGEDGDTGFCITEAENIAFNAKLAAYAHSLGLSFGEKNGGGDTQFISDELNTVHTDWALIEECNLSADCPNYAGYIAAGKAVLNTEYSEDGETTAKFCSQDNAADFDGLLKSTDLDATPRAACRAVTGPTPIKTVACASSGKIVSRAGSGYVAWSGRETHGRLVKYTGSRITRGSHFYELRNKTIKVTLGGDTFTIGANAIFDLSCSRRAAGGKPVMPSLSLLRGTAIVQTTRAVPGSLATEEGLYMPDDGSAETRFSIARKLHQRTALTITQRTRWYRHAANQPIGVTTAKTLTKANINVTPHVGPRHGAARHVHSAILETTSSYGHGTAAYHV